MQIDTETLVELIKFVGVPAALLVALLWFLYKLCRYLADKIIEPVAKRHVEFVDEIALISKKNSETDARFADSLETLSASAQENQKTNDRIADILGNQLEQRNRELNLFQSLVAQIIAKQQTIPEGVKDASG